MTNDLVIETERLTKRFGRRAAVDELSISVPAGVVAGFIGPNGAGKTTTMSMLVGLAAPTAGEGRVLGQPITNPSAYMSMVGALIERPAFYPGLTGDENLRLLATIGDHDAAQIPGLLELVGLGDRGGDRFATYSTGMMQRFGIAAALLGGPALLILDEPTNGLDPVGIHEVRELLKDLADGGRTLFVSSHALVELEQVCDWFVIIDHGMVRFQGRAGDLLGEGSSGLIVMTEHESDIQRLRDMLAAQGRSVQLEDDSLRVELNGLDPRAMAAEVSRVAASQGVALIELHTERITLEERYLSMVNGGKK
jgi:ABC-2 type transport system ATP-binding protein